MNEIEMKEFGSYLKQLRLDKKLSLREVEKAIGISNSYLYQIERGERNVPKLEILRKMATTYDVSFASLMAAAHLQEPEEEAKFFQEDELERAFAYVKTDKRFAFGTHLNGDTLGPEAKRFIVEMYQKLADRKLLPE